MASEPDISRARQLTQLAMAELDGLDRRQTACGDASLRSTLQNIGQRKSEQTWRLLAWLQQHDSATARPSEPLAPGTLDNSGLAESPDPPTEHSASAIATTKTAVDPQSTATIDSAPVIDRRDVTPDLIVFRVARPADFQFSPGQSVKVGLGSLRRTYSIVSAPHEPFLEFFVELVPGGQMSGLLRQLRVNDTVSLGSPKGGLRFDDRVPNHLMIATVTGINPFIGMLRDYVHRGQRGHRMVVMHGASYQDEFGYRQELEQMAAAHPDLLTYRPTISRPDEPRNQGWTGATGRVDTQVDEMLNQHDLGADDTLAYACGHTGMLKSVTGQVQPRGFRLETESYD